MKNTAQIKLLNEIGFAKTVLMPGDPLRAKMIAETFFENAVLVNNVRGIQGYTGFYKGRKISVMASGMGIPSMCIYSHELYNFFGVDKIIRIGTAGSLNKNLNLKDIVVADAVNTDSNIIKQFCIEEKFLPSCSFDLLSCAQQVATDLKIDLKTGGFYSTDLFYNPNSKVNEKWAAKGCVAVEMEAAGLYANAIRSNKKALAICTISDLPLLPGNPGCTVEEREKSFTDMIRIALDVAIRTEHM